MLTNLVVVNVSQYMCVSNCHLYTLNLHNVICQLYISEAGKKLSLKILSKAFKYSDEDTRAHAHTHTHINSITTNRFK